MYNMISQEKQDSLRKERNRKDEEECGRKIKMCLCLCLLFLSCILLLEAIISSVILYCCMGDQYDGPSLNIDGPSYGEDGSSSSSLNTDFP
jgi:hypothetical protein